jgi:hypothetical protein
LLDQFPALPGKRSLALLRHWMPSCAHTLAPSGLGRSDVRRDGKESPDVPHVEIQC